MPGRRFKSSLNDGSSFVVIAELTGGPGYNFAPIESFLAAFRDKGPASIPAGFEFVGIALPQNPGGVANIAPTDVLAKLSAAALLGPLDFIPHISCKDHNSDALTSSLVGYRARGVGAVLALTGDKPVSAKGVFELESVGLLQLIQRMNCQEQQKAKGDDFDAVKQFFPGAAVSPFKYNEASQMQQYYKMEKKIAAGAEFLITQVGWDWRKSLELMQYMQQNDLDVPVLGNVYLLSTTNPAPRLMHDGKLPGCYVSDELLDKLGGESFDQHIERAAQQVAMYRAMGAAGVDLGGVHDYDVFCKVLELAAEIGGDWEQYKDNLYWPREDGFYLYDSSGAQVSLSKPRKRFGQVSFDAAHRLMMDEDYLGFKVFRGVMSALGTRKGKGAIYKAFNAAERWFKYLAFDCEDCGDCYLPENFGYCTLGKCMKGLANAPCGDSTVEGMCGNDLERVCVGDLIYNAAAAARGGREELRGTINDPRIVELQCTASILNYLFGRDHTKRSPLTSIGGALHAAFPTVAAAIRILAGEGEGAYTTDSGALAYIRAMIQSQTDEGASFVALNLDRMDKDGAGAAAALMGEYVKLVRRYGKGAAVCIDSDKTDVLTTGLRQWHDTDKQVGSPLLLVSDIESGEEIIAMRGDFEFRIGVRLGDGEPSADKYVEQARRVYETACKGGFKADEIFFELPVVSLAKDEPQSDEAPGQTYCSMEAMRRIKGDSKLRKCHCLQRVEFSADGMPRKIGVCRAFVDVAMRCGLDTFIGDVGKHYGESPADAKLVKMVEACAAMDGTGRRNEKGRSAVEGFCAANAKKPKRKAPAPDSAAKSEADSPKPVQTST